jgi:hypothetical protein
MPKIERKKELERRRKRKNERKREKNKVLRAQWEQKKQDKKEERIVIKKQFPRFLLQRQKRNKFFIPCLSANSFLLKMLQHSRAETFFPFSSTLGEV